MESTRLAGLRDLSAGVLLYWLGTHLGGSWLSTAVEQRVLMPDERALDFVFELLAFLWIISGGLRLAESAKASGRGWWWS